MPTVIISIADPHLTEKAPRSRKDDYVQTQLRKLADVFTLAANLKIDGTFQPAQAIAIAGDLFHLNQGKLINRTFDATLADFITEKCPCPIAAIPGNHDMLNDRMESLRNHPFGVLVAAGIIQQVTWPQYLTVQGPGDSPNVIITGKEYVPEGPTRWMEALANTKALHKLKEQIGPGTQCLLMTHCFWGPVDGQTMGEPITGHERVRGVGAESHVFGHPHTNDGVVIVQDEIGPVSITGPGALMRGTLAEHDVNRKPCIALHVFYPDGTHKAQTVVVPHEPAEKVFDLEKHERTKTEKETELRFVKELQTLELSTKDPNAILEQLSEKTPATVIAKARQFMEAAEHEIHT